MAPNELFRSLENQLKFIRDGSKTRRYHGLPLIQEETVGYHSFGVAWLVFLLTGSRPSAALLLGALAHDLPEHISGDIPSPTKRELNIRDLVQTYEDEIMLNSGIELVKLNSEEKRILNIADLLDGMMKCAEEKALGNLTPRLALCYKNYMEYAETVVSTTIERTLYSVIKSQWTGARIER